MRILFTSLLPAALALFPAAPCWTQTQPSHPVPELGANLPAQAVGPNDLIAVSVYDAPELSRTVRVGADGMIRLPMLDRLLKAQGFLPADLG